MHVIYVYIVLWTSHKDQSLVRWRLHLTTGFTKIISGLRRVSTASTTDVHIHLYLNYYSVDFFNHVLLIVTNSNAHIDFIS